MPELPDLEVFAANLRSKILDQKITDVLAPGKRVRHRPSPDYPKGRRICDVRRDGKAIRFCLDDGKDFTVHLMLNGFFFISSPEQLGEVRNRKFELWMDRLVFGVGDRQGFAVVDFEPEVPDSPDALSPEFSLQYWMETAARHPGWTIKALLHEQEVVRGIGNAYADEILYDAKVAPQSRVGNVPSDRLEGVHRSVGRVLRSAIRVLERETPDALGGEYRGHLKVHRKDRTTTDSGRLIQIEESGGKKTYFTDEQTVY